MGSAKDEDAITREMGWVHWVKEYRARVGCSIREARDAFDAGHRLPPVASNPTNNAPGSAGQNGAHTPGPWKTDEYAIPERSGSALYIRSDERHWAICSAHETNGCISQWRDISKAEALANAHLIAAAPELVEVAKTLPTHWLKGGVASDPRADHLRIEIRIVGTTYEAEMTVGDLRAAALAIAKATGEGV